jgi:hypothetical protein
MTSKRSCDECSQRTSLPSTPEKGRQGARTLKNLCRPGAARGRDRRTHSRPSESAGARVRREHARNEKDDADQPQDEQKRDDASDGLDLVPGLYRNPQHVELNVTVTSGLPPFLHVSNRVFGSHCAPSRCPADVAGVIQSDPNGRAAAPALCAGLPPSPMAPVVRRTAPAYGSSSTSTRSQQSAQSASIAARPSLPERGLSLEYSRTMNRVSHQPGPPPSCS